MAWIRLPAGKVPSFFHSVQTGSGAQPASYPMGNVGSFLGVKRPGNEADQLPPSSAEINNGGAIRPAPISS
jgi:hypothetical protein